MILNVGIPTSNGLPLILPNQRSNNMKNSIGTISNLTIEIWYFSLQTSFLCYSDRHAPSAKIWILQSNRFRLRTASLWRDTVQWNSTKSLATYIRTLQRRKIYFHLCQPRWAHQAVLSQTVAVGIVLIHWMHRLCSDLWFFRIWWGP